MNANYSNESFRRRHKQEIEIAKTLLMIVVSFLICWFPIAVHFIGEAVTKNWIFYKKFFKNHVPKGLDHELGLIFRSISIVITILNSLIDPLIYTFRMKEVRNGVKKLFTAKIFERHRPDEDLNLNDLT